MYIYMYIFTFLPLPPRAILLLHLLWCLLLGLAWDHIALHGLVLALVFGWEDGQGSHLASILWNVWIDGVIKLRKAWAGVVVLIVLNVLWGGWGGDIMRAGHVNIFVYVWNYTWTFK
jgi:hypothetical protein